MSDKPPPFDAVKASFYLIAFVIGVHCAVVLIGVGACLWATPEILSGRFECDKGNKLSELLAAALATALAFASGFMRQPPKE